MKPIQTPDSSIAHYITFSCFQRRHLFRIPEHYELFLKQLEKTRISKQLNFYAYVVMPNHVHLLVRIPRSLAPSKAFQGLKRTTGYQLLRWYDQNNPEVFRFLKVNEGKRTVKRFWQSGAGFDRHVEGNERSLEKIIEYIIIILSVPILLNSLKNGNGQVQMTGLELGRGRVMISSPWEEI